MAQGWEDLGLGKGAAWGGKTTKSVPLSFMQGAKMKAPIPITIGGTSNRTFTVLASATNPVPLWNGNDYWYQRENLAFSFTTGSTARLDSNGAAATESAAAVGLYYFYVGLVSGVVTILPSTVPPSFVEGPFQNGHFSHPGTTRAAFWNYVGFIVCDAVTPTFVAMTKIGFTYGLTFANAFEVATTGTTFAALAWASDAEKLPEHGALGLTVGGMLETASGATAETHIANDTGGTGELSGSARVASAISFFPFGNIHPTSAGLIVAKDTAARGDIHITQINDIV